MPRTRRITPRNRDALRHDANRDFFIYCTFSKTAGLYYVGSTVRHYNRRGYEHLHDARHTDKRGFKSSRLVYLQPDHKTILLERGQLDKKDKLYVRMRELYHMTHCDLGQCVNDRDPIDLKNVIRESRAITHNMPDIARLFIES